LAGIIEDCGTNMNERIKELAGKANFGYVENDEVVFDKRLEVFAELIVKECADISDASFYNGSAGYLAILKNFGVEE